MSDNESDGVFRGFDDREIQDAVNRRNTTQLDTLDGISPVAPGSSFRSAGVPPTSTPRVRIQGTSSILSPFSHLRRSEHVTEGRNPLHELEIVTDQPSIMADDGASVIRKAELFIHDEIEELDEYLDDVIGVKAKTATELKNKLTDLLAVHSGGDNPWEESKITLVGKLRHTLLQFAKKCNKTLKQRADKDERSRQSMPSSSERSAWTKLKEANVNDNLNKCCDEVDRLIEQFIEVSLATVESDHAYFKLKDRAIESFRCADQVQRELNGISTDAADLERVTDALRARTKVSKLTESRNDAQKKLDQHKRLLGLIGDANTAKILNLKPPVFSGHVSDRIDYYTFKSKFQSYAESRQLSNHEQIQVLLDNCLTGIAYKGCAMLNDLNEIWEHLRRCFGNPRILLSAKIAELKKLGSCNSLDPFAIKDWFIRLNDQISFLHNLAIEHKIETMLYGSEVVIIIEGLLPQHYLTDFHDICFDHGIDITEQQMFEELMIFIAAATDRATFDADLAARRACLTKTGAKTHNSSAQAKKVHTVAGPAPFPPSRKDSRNRTLNAPGVSKNYAAPKMVKCNACQQNHTHAYYCTKFINTPIAQRYRESGKFRACYRCLRLDSDIDYINREQWWRRHKENCISEFVCKHGSCGSREKMKELHITMCASHAQKNVIDESEFIKILDGNQLAQSNPKFFYFAPALTAANMNGKCVNVDTGTPVYGTTSKKGYKILPDVQDPAIFILHEVELRPGFNVTLFYDSGCLTATVADHAHKYLETEVVNAGPTFMNVAGGRTIQLEHGEDRFTLELASKRELATITALRVPHITTPFPVWQLKEAYELINSEYSKTHKGKCSDLPTVPDTIGGSEVGIMLGQRYAKYFPECLFSLPGGLAIYKTKLATPDGHLGCLGGPWAGWKHCMDSSATMNPHDYLSLEMRTYFSQATVLRHPLPVLHHHEINDNLNHIAVDDLDIDNTDRCERKHCDKHLLTDWSVPPSWEIHTESFHVLDFAKQFETTEDIATSVTYRCISCRNCASCRNSELLEKVSLLEEKEQHSIEQSLRYDEVKGCVIAKLPFIRDPVENLKPNRHIAVKILNNQLNNVQKNPEIKFDVLKGFNKLKDHGHVAKISELSKSEQLLMSTTPGSGYYIPWRCVFKENSISTPCRMVFDASSRTPGGESLNTILAKGQNLLIKIFHILIKFCSKPYALTGDISMAYNGIKLSPEFYAYQRFLWKPDLDTRAETEEMCVKTLIYGVKSSGNQTGAALKLLSDHTKKHYPEHKLGADVLANNSYVDDILGSFSSKHEREIAAKGIQFALNQGNMSVKDFVYSGQSPSEKVSTDGQNVGLIGYAWNPVNDEICVLTKELFFGKVVRGKLPPPVEGEIADALRPHFTRRTLLSKIAGVYDPLGKLTPITSQLKLHLHKLLSLDLGWDELIPEEYLKVWVENLKLIQDLRTVWFKRSFLPTEIPVKSVMLIVSTDASKDIAAACVHSRCESGDREVSCRLVAAKSKLVKTNTIPKAELKACVLGATLAHTVMLNMSEVVASVMFVSDSSIALYWLSSDQRPLQLGVRNSVIEIRRFSSPSQWYHVDSENNIADLATRPAILNDVSQNSEWQLGKRWMYNSKSEFPIRTIETVTLNAEEKRLANQEIRNPAPDGIYLARLATDVSDRYCFSNYVIDPCKYSWPKVLSILNLVFTAVEKFKSPLNRKSQVSDETLYLGSKRMTLAEQYFFKIGTKEVMKFSRIKDYRDVSKLDGGILFYTSRILDGQEVLDPENVMLDLQPLTFAQPVLDRFSPISYAIMLHSHCSLARHRNVNSTLLESRTLAFIIGGRSLSVEIRKNCAFCSRYRAQLTNIKDGPLHESRVCIAPAFWMCQLDLFGPLQAMCEHNHRSTVKVWGAVFKCPSTSAISVHAMQKYDAPAFLQAFTRFVSRYGCPQKIFIDEGTQLKSALTNLEINLSDLTRGITTVGTKIEFQTCPVGGHNYNGVVERSIQEVKKLFNMCFNGLKLDLLSYETAFSKISNELNNFPVCLGSRIENLEHLDLISPNRLLLGRINRRSVEGAVQFDKPSRLLGQLQMVTESWWNVWRKEKLADYVPKPDGRKDVLADLKDGSIVLFPRDDNDEKYGLSPWRVGRIVEVERSRDGTVRVVSIQYKNASESKFRQTRRAARKIAVLFQEDELTLIDELNNASRNANLEYIKTNLQGHSRPSAQST